MEIIKEIKDVNLFYLQVEGTIKLLEQKMKERDELFEKKVSDLPHLS